MKLSQFDTKLGPMVAIADDKMLYLLEFVGRRGLEQEIEQLKITTKSDILPGKTQPINLIEQEIHQYFDGKLTEFKTPICFWGTPFQQKVWTELKNIPYGQTRSYADVAKALGKPTAFRAVGNANGSNRLVIIIPCHRVINGGGKLGGYAAGLERKKLLLNLEKTGA